MILSNSSLIVWAPLNLVRIHLLAPFTHSVDDAVCGLERLVALSRNVLFRVKIALPALSADAALIGGIWTTSHKESSPQDE